MTDARRRYLEGILSGRVTNCTQSEQWEANAMASAAKIGEIPVSTWEAEPQKTHHQKIRASHARP